MSALHQKTLLVSLSLSGITSTRADREITAEVLSDKNARSDAGRWVARLWPREAMEPIRALDAQIRAFHYQKTLPWLDKGERIIASRTFMPYMEAMRGFRMQRETLAQGFLDHFDEWLELARDMRGDSFSADDYPTVRQARARFRFELSSAPVPHSSDFRVDLAAGEMELVQASLDERVREAELAARRDLYRRMAEPVCKLLERLADPDARFTTANLNALRDLVTEIPDINLLDDPEVERLRAEIDRHLCHLDVESVSTSRSDRSRATSKANAILSVMAPWLSDEELAGTGEPALA